MTSTWVVLGHATDAGVCWDDVRPGSIEEFFLERLARLETLRAVCPFDPQQRRLLDLATYSTYQDCVDLGLRSRAREILHLSPA
jgi:hypothetical protein